MLHHSPTYYTMYNRAFCGIDPKDSFGKKFSIAPEETVVPQQDRATNPQENHANHIQKPNEKCGDELKDWTM